MAGDLESCKRAIVTRLLSNDFTAALAAVDAAHADDLSTPLPGNVFPGEKINHISLFPVGTPVGEVIGIKTSYRDSAHYHKAAVHEIHVAWTQTGDDEMTITTHVERLIEAMRALFWPDGDEPVVLTEVGAVGALELVSEDYTFLAPHRNKTGFVKGSWTTVLIPVFSA